MSGFKLCTDLSLHQLAVQVAGNLQQQQQMTFLHYKAISSSLSARWQKLDRRNFLNSQFEAM